MLDLFLATNNGDVPSVAWNFSLIYEDSVVDGRRTACTLHNQTHRT